MEDLTQVKINELWTIFRRQLSELLTNAQLDPHSRDPGGTAGGSPGVSTNSRRSADVRVEQVQREKDTLAAPGSSSPLISWKPPLDTAELENDAEGAVLIVSPAGNKPAIPPERFGETVPVVHSRLGPNLFLHHSRPFASRLPPKQTPVQRGEVYVCPQTEDPQQGGRWSRMCSRYLMSSKERSKRKSRSSPPMRSGEGSEGEGSSHSRHATETKGTANPAGEFLGSESEDGGVSVLEEGEQYSSPSSPPPWDKDSESEEGTVKMSSDRHPGGHLASPDSTPRRHRELRRSRVRTAVGRRREHMPRGADMSPSPHSKEQGGSAMPVPLKPCTVIVQRESGKAVAEQLKKLQGVRGSPLREAWSPCTPVSSVSSTPSKVSVSVLTADSGKMPEVDPLSRNGSRRRGLSESSVDTHCDNAEFEKTTPTSTPTSTAAPSITAITTPKMECDHASSQSLTSGRKKGLSLHRGSTNDRVVIKEMPSGSQQPSHTRTSLPEVIVCTACGASIKWKNSPIHEHQRLHVLVCQICWASFNSGSFIVGEDNTENYCTLCGEGGDLVCCDACIKSFCQACIRRTSGEPFLQSLLQEDSTWHCYCCDGRPLSKQQKLCKDLCDYYLIKKKEGDTSGNETDPLIVTSTAVKKVREDGATPTRGKEWDEERRRKAKKFKTPALINSDSSTDGEESVEVGSDDVEVSDVEADLKKLKKTSRRAVVKMSSESEHEVRLERKGSGGDQDGGKALKKKKKRHGRRWQLGSECGGSSSDSGGDEAHPLRAKKRSWSSSTSESASKSKKLKHSELAAAVSSESDDDSESKRCGVKVEGQGTSSSQDILKGAEDSSELVTAVTYAPFRALSTSGSDEEVTDQRPRGGVAIAESSTDSEDVTVVGGKQPPAVRGSDSDVVERRGHFPRGPPNKKKRVVRGPLSSDEDSAEEPKDQPAKKDGEEEGEEEPEDSQDMVAGKKRRKIREIIADSKLTVLTKEAQKQEKERIERLKARAATQGTLAEQRLVLEEDPKTKEVKVEVRRSLVPSLLPHQKEGVKFLYDSCIESLERLQSEGRTKGNGGGGCILAHCMGLGKTVQIIAFLDSLMSVSDSGISKALILIPVNALHNWMKEFLYWVPNEKRNYEIFMVSMLDTGVKARYHKLKYWHEQGGVMLMGFEMFRNLAVGSRLKQKSHQMGFKQFLLDPGPDIIVCDEGHVLRSSKSNLSTIVNQVKTRCRVVLTGTPLQNNLLEYYTMVSFVKPNLLGTQKEFTNRFVNPIVNGQCRDSTSQDVRRMKQRAHVLHDMLKASVQRRDYRVLAECLPPKQEYVLAIRLSPVQDQLYRLYLEHTRGYHTASDLFSTFATLLKIWDHPWVLKLNEDRREAKRECEDVDTSDSLNSFIVSGSDEEDDVGKRNRNKRKKGKSSGPTADDCRDPQRVGVAPVDDVIVIDTDDEKPRSSKGKETVSKRLQLEARGSTSSMEPLMDDKADSVAGGRFWFNKVISNVENRLDFSGKLVFLVELLRETEKLGEKVLVFSQSLTLLDLIEEFLSRPEYGEWTPGLDYYRLDGSTRSDTRMSFMDHFNATDSPRLRLFIISTKAGSLGVNLVAANRVVIFDACWNPSHDLQSIFRTYRFGQTKPVFVYRLLAKGTMEEKIYDRQVTKQSLSMRVVDEKQIGRHYTQSDLSELFTYSPPPTVAETAVIKGPEVDPVLCALMDKLQPEWIVGYHEHDSLLQHIFDEELTEEDRKQAWEQYKAQMDAETGVYNLRALQSHLNQGPQTSQSAFTGQPIGQQAQVAISVLQSAIGKVRTLNKLQEDKSRLNSLLPQVPETRQGLIKEELSRLKQQISTEYTAVAESIKNVNRFLTSCHSGNIVLDAFLSHNINYLRSILSDELQKMKTSGGFPQQQHTNAPTYSSAQAIPGKTFHQTLPERPL